MYDRKSFTKTLEVVQDFYEEKTVDSGKAQHMLAPSERAMHAKHMMDRHSVKTKFHGKDEVSYHGPLSNVKRALSNHYGGDISQAKDLHPIMMKNEEVENVDENIISRLTGGHGRYMKKLKMAHDHHDTMMKAHSDMEHHIDPSAGSDPDSNRDPDHQYVHGQATQAHYHAREAIKKLAAHAKKNKLTSHPKGSEYKDAKESSAEANENSRDAISRDRSNKSMGRGRAPYRGPYSGYASKNYDTHPATVVSQNFVKGHRGEISKTKTDHHKSLD